MRSGSKYTRNTKNVIEELQFQTILSTEGLDFSNDAAGRPTPDIVSILTQPPSTRDSSAGSKAAGSLS